MYRFARDISCKFGGFIFGHLIRAPDWGPFRAPDWASLPLFGHLIFGHLIFGRISYKFKPMDPGPARPSPKPPATTSPEIVKMTTTMTDGFFVLQGHGAHRGYKAIKLSFLFCFFADLFLGAHVFGCGSFPATTIGAWSWTSGAKS